GGALSGIRAVSGGPGSTPTLSLHVFQDLVAAPFFHQAIVAARLLECPTHIEGDDEQHEHNRNVVAFGDNEPQVLARLFALDAIQHHRYEQDESDQGQYFTDRQSSLAHACPLRLVASSLARVAKSVKPPAGGKARERVDRLLVERGLV